MKKSTINIITAAFMAVFFCFLAIPGRAQKKESPVIAHDDTDFPLIGKHRTAACGECHLKGIMQGTPTACEACHWYRKKDDRYQLHLGLHCGDCHTPFDWKKIKPGAWNHKNNTGFALNAAHNTVDCFQCHKNNFFTGLPRDCFSCHSKDYYRTTEPNHEAAGYSTDCGVCHTGGSWEMGGSNHPAFPLKGSHKTAACSDCHKNNRYAGTPSNCAACHLDDYNRVHKSDGFSMDCVACHGDEAISWEGASFDHNQSWPLQGAHRTLDCNECHSAGYDLPRNCNGCHMDDYNNARDPNHKTAGFPISCSTCHFPTHMSWDQAVFDHKFPIFSGNHSRIGCSQCHTKGNYVEFSCIDCHEHGKRDMDSEHRGIGGYSYNSQACYSCHPQGKD